MAVDAESRSNLAIPPGEYLEEVIRKLGMSTDELAQRMNRLALARQGGGSCAH